jgi:hypothetical protein
MTAPAGLSAGRCFWARLLDGDHAYILVKPARPGERHNPGQGGGVIDPDAHPLFQIDGNFGHSRGKCCRKSSQQIHLLPALPSVADGSVRDLRLRRYQWIFWRDEVNSLNSARSLPGRPACDMEESRFHFPAGRDMGIVAIQDLVFEDPSGRSGPSRNSSWG